MNGDAPMVLPQETAPQSRLRDLVLGFLTPRAIHAAAHLNVAELLADGAQDVGFLAAATRTHAPTLYRVMRALAGAGVFVEEDAGRFRNSPLSHLLRPHVAGSLRAWALMCGSEASWDSCRELLHSLRTGGPAFDRVHGMNYFEYLSAHPQAAEIFDEAMVSASSMVSELIVAAYDFSPIRTLVDVAGGYGATLCAILKENPGLRGTLFDMPHVIRGARDRIARLGLAGRCSLAGGDFFEAIPAGADAYFMKHILHDWGDQSCTRILGNCRAAMAAGGRVLVCEKEILPGNTPCYGKVSDLQMLMLTPGGRERTQLEYRKLFDDAGLALRRVVPTGSPWIILEGMAA
jgi:hypothetical protein